MNRISTRMPAAASASPVGVLLREWRAARRLSQLDLALEAGMSARHLSCVENGKSRPSREAVARLADALEMPLRERNALLVAAGYAPMHPETALGTPALEQVRRAVECILEQQEPYPAFVINRHWDILIANRAAANVNRFLLGGHDSGQINMLRRFFDPNDLRAVLVNWEEIAGDLLRHLHGHLAATPSDTTARALRDEVLRYPGVPLHWHRREPGTAPSPLLTTVFRRDGRELRFFSTITTFATPHDVTLDELRIECVFPEDDATARLCRELAGMSEETP